MKPKTSRPDRELHSEFAPLFFDELERLARTDGGLLQPGQMPDLARALVTDAVRERASDIHLEPRSVEVRVRFRIDGVVWDVASLKPEDAKWVLNQFKAMADLDPVVNFNPRDAHASLPVDGFKLDLRLALAPSQSGEAMSIRLLDSNRLDRSIERLGLSEDYLDHLKEWLENMHGLFLAAGPTGSGKSTTIYALLRELKYSDRIIVSLEEPVECQIDGIVQIELDLKHHLDFVQGIKSIMRLDPDYVMLGEIRDSSSAHAAVDAAITGRVLLSTLHCRDAVGAVGALRNWGLGDHEIAESLGAVLAQRLVRTLCTHCRKKTAPSASDRRWLQSHHLPVPKTVWEPVGCKKCRGLGYFGRTGIFELWRLDAEDYDRILAHLDEHGLREHLVKKKHVPLLLDGVVKVKDGITSVAELRSRGSGYPSRAWAPPA